MVAVLALLISRPAAADQPVHVSARAFGGLEDGLGLTVAGPERRLEAEVSYAAFALRGNDQLMDAALAFRVLGTSDRALSVRAGYLHADIGYSGTDRPDVSDSFDLGVRLSVRSPAGHGLTAELGLEEVIRKERFYCCDSAGLDPASFGVRVMLAGELALAQHLALFAHLGVRTAAHLLEIRILPVAMAGVAVNF
jgi:hypothetical protein